MLTTLHPHVRLRSSARPGLPCTSNQTALVDQTIAMLFPSLGDRVKQLQASFEAFHGRDFSAATLVIFTSPRLGNGPILEEILIKYDGIRPRI